jgi:hypothetical protein
MTKLLFRIVHQWATHVDLEEFLELLKKIYLRITHRKVVRTSNNEVRLCYPTIHVEIVPEDHETDDSFRAVAGSNDAALYETCQKDEAENDQYDYAYLEDAVSMTVAKHKKRKLPITKPPGDAGLGLDSTPVLTIKEALLYKEHVKYYQNNGDYKPCSEDLVSYVLTDLVNVLPFGYPTEQYLVWTRNDVHNRLEEGKRQKKEYMAMLKRKQIDEGGSSLNKDPAGMKKEEDDGVIPGAEGFVTTVPFPMKTVKDCKTKSKVEEVDKLYNAIRSTVKDTNLVAIKLFMENPKLFKGEIVKQRSHTGNEPVTEVNKHGFNPCLNRRILLKQVPIFSNKGKPEFVNINYIYALPDFEAAYRCDFEKYEKSNKLAIPPNEDLILKEEFTPCETTYK